MSDEALNLLKDIQQNNFAAYDMLLYLDTHADDKKAFKIYKSLVAKTRELMAEFEEKYGPLRAFNAADQPYFNWLQEPWPWEKEGNK